VHRGYACKTYTFPHVAEIIYYTLVQGLEPADSYFYLCSHAPSADLEAVYDAAIAAHKHRKGL
jgi:hypothetical protein